MCGVEGAGFGTGFDVGCCSTVLGEVAVVVSGREESGFIKSSEEAADICVGLISFSGLTFVFERPALGSMISIGILRRLVALTLIWVF